MQSIKNRRTPKGGAKPGGRRSIKLDAVNPRDFMKYDTIFACEQCSHYDSGQHHCTMGYNPQFTRDRQLALYNLTGKMAFCRFLEID